MERDAKHGQPPESSGAAQEHPYRADIDGLRAVAVLLVLGFHAFPNRVPGGFVGVDVFFVISGYLITGIILSATQAGRFRLSDFYARRIRRIFPSLLVVSAACLVAGWSVLLPDEYSQLGKHVFAGAAFVSNFAFWREAGYFDSAAHTKPLLHLWSLGIEEQFYLVWPFFVTLAWRYRRDLVRPTLGVAVGSFALCIWVLRWNAVAAFYLPVTRFWELLLGGLLAGFSKSIRSTTSPPSPIAPSTATRPIAGIQSAGGAFLIILSALAMDDATVFPGWAALPPTLGAVLVISAGPTAWVNRRLLSARLMVWIGLISFPLYLWHWPLLSFARILAAETPSRTVRLLLLISSIFLASLTYLLVEKPVRAARQRGLTVLIPSVGLFVVGAIGLAVYSRGGLPSRFPDAQLLALTGDLNLGGWGPDSDRQVDCADRPAESDAASTECRLSSANPPTMVLLGDSHATHLFPGLAQADPKRTWLLLSRAGCAPTLGLTISMGGKPCGQFGEWAVEKIRSTPSIETVVLSFISAYVADSIFAADHLQRNMHPSVISSQRFLATSRQELFFLGLNDLVNTLEESGKKVVVFIDIPELPFFPRDCLRRSLTESPGGGCSLPAATVVERQAAYRKLLRRLAEAHPKIRMFDPLKLFCPAESCVFRDDTMLFYRDSHHLSLRGSAWMAPRFLEWMSEGETALPSRPASSAGLIGGIR